MFIMMIMIKMIMIVIVMMMIMIMMMVMMMVKAPVSSRHEIVENWIYCGARKLNVRKQARCEARN